MASKWFQRGKEGIEKSKQIDAAIKTRREQSGAIRFWLKADESAKFTFLDSPDFFLHEHNLKLGGKFFNFFTCIQEADTCPICESGDNPSYVLVATVINHREYTDKEGKKHKNQKQLLVLKGRAKDKIIRQIEKRQDLKFCTYESHRGAGPTECSYLQ